MEPIEIYFDGQEVFVNVPPTREYNVTRRSLPDSPWCAAWKALAKKETITSGKALRVTPETDTEARMAHKDLGHQTPKPENWSLKDKANEARSP